MVVALSACLYTRFDSKDWLVVVRAESACLYIRSDLHDRSPFCEFEVRFRPHLGTRRRRKNGLIFFSPYVFRRPIGDQGLVDAD